MRVMTGPRGLKLTELGLGGAQLGNLYRAMSDAHAAATVSSAWNAGIRHFDTAPHYGLGLSERRLGDALAAYPRGELVVSTKVGRLLVPSPSAGRRLDPDFVVPATHQRVWDFSRDGVRRSLTESLERLGLDRVDIVYLHDPEQHWDQALREGLPALLELRDEGVVRAVGAGMNYTAPLAELVRNHDVDLVMCAGRHTLLERSEELLGLALERGVGVVLAGVYASGLLATTRPAVDTHYDYLPAPTALVARAHELADLCQTHGTTLPEVALAFGLRHPAVLSVVVGAEGPAQVAQSLERLVRAVPEAVWTELDRADQARPT